MVGGSGAVRGDGCDRYVREGVRRAITGRGDVRAIRGKRDRIGGAVEVETERRAIEVREGGGVDVDVRDLVVLPGDVTRDGQAPVAHRHAYGRFHRRCTRRWRSLKRDSSLQIDHVGAIDEGGIAGDEVYV